MQWLPLLLLLLQRSSAPERHTVAGITAAPPGASAAGCCSCRAKLSLVLSGLTWTSWLSNPAAAAAVCVGVCKGTSQAAAVAKVHPYSTHQSSPPTVLTDPLPPPPSACLPCSMDAAKPWATAGRPVTSKKSSTRRISREPAWAASRLPGCVPLAGVSSSGDGSTAAAPAPGPAPPLAAAADDTAPAPRADAEGATPAGSSRRSPTGPPVAL